jgi:DNA-binding LacI/PurR family transcriptional regulator
MRRLNIQPIYEPERTLSNSSYVLDFSVLLQLTPHCTVIAMVTQRELAKLAGVSAGTVSNVISGSTRVSEAARRRVLDAIRVLNYQPNLIARSLKTNRTHTLGIVVPDLTIPFFPKVVRGAESAAREKGYFLIVLDSQRSHDLEVEMMALLWQRVDGILLVTAGDHRWSTESAAAVASGPPVVCVDRLPEGLNTDSVSVDDGGAAELGIRHLLSLGHRKIAIITGPISLRNEQERLRGYRRALREAGIPFLPSLVWSTSFDMEDIHGVCQRGLLRQKPKPTALFATNGITGMCALKSLYSLGFKTPDNIAFVTFDELIGEDFFQPRITSVVQPTYEIGHRAVEVLFDRIRHGRSSTPSRVRLPATLIVRESSRMHVG